MLTKLFVAGDVVSFTLQGRSAGFMFVPGLAKIGQAMVIAGLFIQIIMFALFAVTALIFEVRAPNSRFKSSPRLTRLTLSPDSAVAQHPNR